MFSSNILNKFFQLPKFYHLPIGWEHCDKFLPIFDTVMCMGVLYHQKNPIELLEFLKKPLKKFGELILETLIIDSEEDTQLVPLQRYAAMKNVFSIITSKHSHTYAFSENKSIKELDEIIDKYVKLLGKK